MTKTATKIKNVSMETLLSPKAKAKQAATRVNRKNDLAHIAYSSDKANYSTKGSSKFTPRKRDPAEALPPAQDLWLRGNYRTGDGDVLGFQRPNSNHSHIKSFGNQT